jgi:hypothetical protein
MIVVDGHVVHDFAIHTLKQFFVDLVWGHFLQFRFFILSMMRTIKILHINPGVCVNEVCILNGGSGIRGMSHLGRTSDYLLYSRILAFAIIILIGCCQG